MLASLPWEGIYVGFGVCTANGRSDCDFITEKKANGNVLLPFIVTEFIPVVISWDDVDQQDVLGLGVHSGHFNLVTRKHPP